MKIITRTLFAVLLVLPVFALTQELRPTAFAMEDESPIPTRWNLKTNLLYDATATFNLGVEFRTGFRTSLDIPFNYNPFTFSENRKWKHLLIQPEWRWWTQETFDGHFFGLHAHYAFYNVGNLPDPFSDYMKANRFEGWLVGAGISYGYRWNFRNSPWAMEATLGAGYAYLDYDRFECGRCGVLLDKGTKHYFGPTRIGLSLIASLGKARVHPVEPLFAPAPEPIPEPVLVYEPVFIVSFVTPEAEPVKTRSESGKAYLDFAVGRAEILPNFRNNAAELQKIHTTIENVKNDPNATITRITITGHASPEGNAASNQALSERRAESLSHHLRSTYELPAGLFSVWGAGEDWQTLEALVKQDASAQKESQLRIIRGAASEDARELQLKALGSGPYRQLVEEEYPRLRRSDYTITYTVAPFTVEQSKEVFKSRPGNLSLDEMYRIAATYTPAGKEFNEVFETAARVFPESDEANLNAAAAALSRRDPVLAANYLERVNVRNAAYWNNLGLLAWLQGDKTHAAACFAKGGTQGQTNARELEHHLQSVPGDKQQSYNHSSTNF